MKDNYDNIVLIGMPGSGKTSIGRILAKKINMCFYDLDEYIERKSGKRITEIFAIYGERHFRTLESRAVKEISSKTNAVISTGGGVVLDSKNMHVLNKRGIIFFINRPVEDIAHDIEISSRPLLANDRDNIYRLYKDRYELYKKYSDFEILNDRGILEAVKQIIEILNGNYA
ncbi:MAG: shikimate kinase [Tepidanaerobacter acetatoxydans]|uniref:shikimate kinase n=1 Tax=Tepidanaerobacter acetatoxydans TaxID=499229 RepID=UPI0023EFAD1D|nr:shikimate kinase [Tepidanaerobacter acetatoxydans]NLU09763.1 shikimate kinase [Tepidanaerobacter acetatoxydans]